MNYTVLEGKILSAVRENDVNKISEVKKVLSYKQTMLGTILDKKLDKKLDKYTDKTKHDSEYYVLFREYSDISRLFTIMKAYGY